MPFCVNCGNENPAGVHFCSKCGAEQDSTAANCPNCGKTLEENEKFCSGCGTPVAAEPIKSEAKTANPKPAEKDGKFTKEGRKIIDAGPKPNQFKPKPNFPTQPKSRPPKKKRSLMGCLGKSLLIFLGVIIIGVVIIWNLPDDEDILTDTNIPGIVDIEDGDKLNQKSDKISALGTGSVINEQTIVIDEQNPIATSGAVKVDFGQFNINKKANVKIEEFAKQVIDEECSVFAYNIEVKGKSTFDDYLTISLPYDDSFIETGDANNCVVAQYFNEKTKNWEPVLFTTDTKNKVVIIETDHLSKYGIFTVKDETKRRAYISGFYIPNNYFTRDKTDLHLDIIDEYYSGGRSLGEEALSKGLSFWGEFSGKSGAAVNTLTLGGMYSTKLINKLNDGFKNAGYVASTVQLAYDLWRGDQKSAAINLTKNLMNQIVAELNITSLNLAFVGVYFIDYSLTKFGNAAMASRYEELFKVYNYYNKNQNSHKRTLKEWRAFFIETEKENEKNPQQASNLIMDEIDAYSREFIDKLGLGTNNENTMEFNALAGEAGVKSVAWPNPDDVSKIQQEGKQQLIDKLYPVFASLNHYRINKMKEELIKECNKIQKTMNTVVPITIMEDLDKGKKPEYANHIVCIRPLDSDADKKQWTGKLNKNGFIKTSFSILGFVQAGEPNKVEIYDPEDIPDDDDPILVKEFVVNEEGIVVILGNGVDEEEMNLLPILHRMHCCQLQLSANFITSEGKTQENRIYFTIDVDSESKLIWNGTSFSFAGNSSSTNYGIQTITTTGSLNGNMSHNGNRVESVTVLENHSEKTKIDYPKDKSKPYRIYNINKKITFSSLPYIPFGKSGFPQGVYSYQIVGEAAKEYLTSFKYIESGYNEDRGEHSMSYTGIDWSKPVQLVFFFH